MELRYYFNIKSVLCCLLKMNKYFDMNEISKIDSEYIIVNGKQFEFSSCFCKRS